MRHSLCDIENRNKTLLELSKYSLCLIINDLLSAYGKENININSVIKKIVHLSFNESTLEKMVEKKLRKILNVNEMLNPIISHMCNLITDYDRNEVFYKNRIYNLINLNEEAVFIKGVKYENIKAQYENYINSIENENEQKFSIMSLFVNNAMNNIEVNIDDSVSNVIIKTLQYVNCSNSMNDYKGSIKRISF